MKTNIRTILCLLFVALFLILSMPLHLVLWLIGRKKPMTKYRVSHKVIRWAFRVVFGICGIRVHSFGSERIPQDTPVLFVSNHRSNLDILLIQTTAGRLCCKEGTGKDSTSRILDERYRMCLP